MVRKPFIMEDMSRWAFKAVYNPVQKCRKSLLAWWRVVRRLGVKTCKECFTEQWLVLY